LRVDSEWVPLTELNKEFFALEETLKTEKENKQKKEGLIFNLSLTDTLRLTMFGTLIAIANTILRMPIHMPAHTSIWWMGILVLGRGLIPKKGAGIIMGIVSGVVIVLLGDKDGPLTFIKFLMPGITLDIMAPVFFNKLESPIVGAICGALASVAKMIGNVAVGFALKLPMVFLTLGLGFTAISHVIFGAIGGVVATLLIKRLKPRLLNWD